MTGGFPRISDKPAESTWYIYIRSEFRLDDVESDQSILARLPTILFFVTGVFWAGIIASGGGVLLAWAVLTCFVSGAFLVMWSASWITKPLVASSSLFGLVLTVYQLYVGLTVLGTGLPSVALVSVPLFVVFTLVYLYLLYDGALRRET